MTDSKRKTPEERDTYGLTAREWLERWDAGETVWTVEMGGLGPGYEQAIQITVAALVRHMLDAAYNAEAWDDEGSWKRDRDAIQAHSFDNPTIKALRLSGAQFGAALHVAAKFVMSGPRAVLEAVPDDRRIMVSKHFPEAVEEATA